VATVLLVTLAAACGGGSETAGPQGDEAASSAVEDPPSPAVEEAASRPAVALELSVYVVDGESPQFRSSRTIDEARAILDRVNEIWAQAGIAFELAHIARVQAPDAQMQALAAGEIGSFLASLGREVPVERPSLLNMLYVRSIGGPNGIAPANSRVALVIDDPSVDDERVTAHELGHHLGLHHVRDDPGRLLFSGTNGREIVDEEAAVAAYVARGLLDGVR
jgi:hypothetical protein